MATTKKRLPQWERGVKPGESHRTPTISLDDLEKGLGEGMGDALLEHSAEVDQAFKEEGPADTDRTIPLDELFR